MTDALAINLDASCWLWMKARIPNGYGVIRRNHKLHYAHRYMWTVMRGPIPNGMTIDHLCRNRACVNPQHLEIVSLKVNILRGNGAAARHARATHCPAGHKYDEANTRRDRYGYRHCRACQYIRDLERRR